MVECEQPVGWSPQAVLTTSSLEGGSTVADSHITSDSVHRQSMKGHKGFHSREQHPDWVGNAVSVAGGRSRARLWYQDQEPCADCGGKAIDRHHQDGDTGNNNPENIVWLCRRCHMKRDGRLVQLNTMRPEAVIKANKVRWGNRKDTEFRPGEPCPICGKALNTGRRRHYDGYDMVTVKCLKRRNGCGFNAGAFKESTK